MPGRGGKGGVNPGAGGKVKGRKTNNSRSADIDTPGQMDGDSPLSRLMAEMDGEPFTPEELDAEEVGEERRVEIEEQAVGPGDDVVFGKIRNVAPENYEENTHDGLFRCPIAAYESFKPPADLTNWPSEPTLILKYKVCANEFKAQLFHSEPIIHELHFNQYLDSEVPDTHGCWLEVSMTQQQLVFLPNTPFTKFHGITEGIRDGSMTPMNCDGPVTFSEESINAFDHIQYCLSFRYAITWNYSDNALPILDIRVLRKNQTEATSYITSLDVSTMHGGSIPLHIFRPQDIVQADGMPYAVYLSVFHKGHNIGTYKKFLDRRLPGFLALVMAYKNHSLRSYASAIRQGISGNTKRFATRVKSNHRLPLEPVSSNSVANPANVRTPEDLRAQNIALVEQQLRKQNAYASSRPGPSGLPLLVNHNPMTRHLNRTIGTTAPQDSQTPVSPAHPQRSFPVRSVFNNDEEHFEEEVEESQTQVPTRTAPPPPRSAPPKTTAPAKRKATETPPIDPHLSGIELYKDLLMGGQISGSTNILRCQAMALTASDLHEIFPNISEDTLNSPSSLIITLRALEEMNRVAEPKLTSSSSKVSMETLISNRTLVTKPRSFPACMDDLSLENTSLRVFHRLPLSDMQAMFMADARNHQDMTPIAGYNLSDVNGASHVKEKGWQAIQNPGMHDVSIRDFVTRSFSSQQDKRLKIDGDFSIVDNSAITDAENIKALKKAVTLLIRLYHMSHPMLLNYHTLLAFLIDIDWMYFTEKKGLTQVKYATGFIDFYLNGIGDNYRSITPPPTKTELNTILKSFHDSISGQSGQSGQSNQGQGRGNRNNNKGRNSSNPNPNTNPPGGQQNRASTSSGPSDGPNIDDLCTYYNKVTGCNRENTDPPHTCDYNGTRFKHKCNKIFANGRICLKLHPRATNH